MELKYFVENLKEEKNIREPKITDIKLHLLVVKIINRRIKSRRSVKMVEIQNLKERLELSFKTIKSYQVYQ